MSKLSLKAKSFAERVHAEQFRKYTGLPYAVHLREVADLCFMVGCRDEVVAAAWLHDAKEDQGILDVELRTLFGDDVARLVEEVTDQSRPSDGNRKVRKTIDRRHLSRASAEGMTIKLADLISNGRDISTNDPNFAVAYMHEMQVLLPLLIDGNPILYARAEKMIKEYFEGQP